MNKLFLAVYNFQIVSFRTMILYMFAYVLNACQCQKMKLFYNNNCFVYRYAYVYIYIHTFRHTQMHTWAKQILEILGMFLLNT